MVIPKTDPTYRIGKVEAANRPPAAVAPEAPIRRAVTLMMTNDYSQLPVMQGERTVKGILSWASIGQRLAFGQAANTAMDCAVPHHEISADTSLFEAIDGIIRPCEALQSAGHPGALAQVAASLKRKVKQMTSASRRSEFLFELRKLRPVP